jgi:type II secretion system protein N
MAIAFPSAGWATLKKSSAAFGYVGYFMLCTLVFAYCTFPYDRVRDRIETEVERAVPGSDLEIVSLGPSWLTGVSAEGVSLTLPSEREGDPPATLVLSELNARVGLWAALTGSQDVTFSAILGGGGDIAGRFRESESETYVSAHLTDVELARIAPLRRVVPLPLAGTLSGDVDLTLAEEVENTNGTVTLTIAGLALGDGRARLQLPGMPGSGVTIERVDAGTLNLRIDVEHGVGRVQQLAAASDDIDVRGAGTVRFLRPARMSSLDLMLRVDIKQPYRERNDRTRAVFSLLEMSPEARLFKTPEGALQFRLSGSLAAVRAQPAGSATLPQ